MGSVHRTETVIDLKTQPVAAVENEDPSSPAKRSLSSSSSDSSSEVLCQVDADDFSESAASSPPKLGGRGRQSLSGGGEDKFFGISVPEHGTETIADLKKTQHAAAADNEDPPTPAKRPLSSSSSSSCSSSDSSSGVLFQVDADEFRETPASSPPKLGGGGRQLVLEDGEGKNSGISTPKHDQADDILGPTPVNSSSAATLSPPIQVMERPAEPAPYRIPSSVFSRTTISTSPMDWSVASNESLFSIHTGNMSFTKEQLSMFCKSGELDRPGGQSMNFTSSHVPVNKTIGVAGPKSGELGEDLVVSEAAAETRREVLKANPDQQSKEKMPVSTPNSGNVSPCSGDSTDSHNSFAFPVLAGEGAKSGSVEKGLLPQQSPKQSHQQAQPKSEQPPQTESWEAVTAGAAQKRWFSCFSCCP